VELAVLAADGAALPLGTSDAELRAPLHALGADAAGDTPVELQATVRVQRA